MPSSEQVQPTPPEPPPPIRWRSWPVRDEPGRGLLVTIGLVTLTVAIGWLSGEVYLALAALAALVVALWRFFLPVAFELSGEGVDQRLLGRRRRLHRRRCAGWDRALAGGTLRSRG